MLTKDREFNLTLKVQYESACHTTIYAKNYTRLYSLTWGKLQVPQ